MTKLNIWALDEGHPETGPGIMGVQCGDCGAVVKIKLPVSVDDMVGLLHDFGRRHQGCADIIASDSRSTRRARSADDKASRFAEATAAGNRPTPRNRLPDPILPAVERDRELRDGGPVGGGAPTSTERPDAARRNPDPDG